jgi:ribose transport system substrate-binding protein
MTQPAAEPARPKSSRAAFYISVIVLLLIGVGGLLYLNRGAFLPLPKVALITSTEDSYWDLVLVGANDAAKEHNVNLTVIRSKADEKHQSQVIRDLLAKGVGGLGISPVDPAAQKDLLKEVASKGTLVTFDSDAPESNRLAFIGSDNYGAGWYCGDEIRAAIPDGGKVILSVGTIDKANGRQRRQAIIDNLLERPFERERAADPLEGGIKGKQYTIVTTLIDNGDPEKATTLATEAINKHPDLKCFAGLFGYSTPALLKALEQTKKTGQIKLVAFDEADEVQQGIESGTVAASILQDQYLCGYEAVRLLADAARGLNRGTHPNRILYLDTRVLTKETMEDLRKEGRLRAVGKK